MTVRCIVLFAALLAGPVSAQEARPVAYRDAPRLARDARIAGTVVVQALVDSTGRVRATSIERSQPVLDDEAAARVARMRLTPLRSGGALVPSLQSIPVKFEPPPGSGPADTWARNRCEDATFTVDVDVRPDSSGRFTARWRAKGLKSQELFVIALSPDGTDVDTTGTWFPQSFQDGEEGARWPSWHREGSDVRKGTEGTFTFTLPAEPWWSVGRFAIVALFHDIFDGRNVVRQRAWRVDRDAMGPLLIGDATATPCAAGPWREGR
jgi:TonB family protein